MPKYFPVTSVKTKIVEVVVGGDGQRDIDFPDSIDISEALAGIIGPVQTQDSLDISTTLVVQELDLADSLDTDEAFTPLTLEPLIESADLAVDLSGIIGPIRAPDTLDATDDPVIGPLVVQDSLDTDERFTPIDLAPFLDSVDISEALAGVIGPIVTQASIDATDDPIIGPLVVQESFDTDDTSFVTILNAVKLDSIDISDRLREIIVFANETYNAADQLGGIDLRLPDSTDIFDAFGPVSTQLGDSLTAIDVANADLTFDIPDSLDGTDLATFGPASVGESKAVADLRGIADVNATNWANQVISQSGMTNPNNLIDLNEGTGTTISVTQSGGLLGGNSQSASGNITVALPDPTLVPTPTVVSAQLQWGWTTTASGGLQNGNSVNAVIAYSLDDGGSFITLETVTNTAGTGNPTLNITATYAQLQQIRFRVTVTVASGTTLVTGGATQTFSMRYARCVFNVEQSL